MACPNRDNDLQIIKEVARRKAAAALTQKDILYDTFVHIGELTMILPFMENRIEKIVRIDEQSWQITTKTKME